MASGLAFGRTPRRPRSGRDAASTTAASSSRGAEPDRREPATHLPTPRDLRRCAAARRSPATRAGSAAGMLPRISGRALAVPGQRNHECARCRRVILWDPRRGAPAKRGIRGRARRRAGPRPPASTARRASRRPFPRGPRVVACLGGAAAGRGRRGGVPTADASARACVQEGRRGRRGSADECASSASRSIASEGVRAADDIRSLLGREGRARGEPIGGKERACSATSRDFDDLRSGSCRRHRAL